MFPTYIFFETGYIQVSCTILVFIAYDYRKFRRFSRKNRDFYDDEESYLEVKITRIFVRKILIVFIINSSTQKANL